jgi:transcription initiation factor IIF auxiliary subunit
MNKQLNLIIVLLLLTYSLAAQNITVTNTAAAKQNGSYDWTIFIQADDATLNLINHAEYLLNSSFTTPQVSSNNRAAKFGYSSASRAEFEIKVKVFFNDGNKAPLYISYWLKLR